MVGQIYYSVRTLLCERGTNIIRAISLSLGSIIGILLFSQIVFELSYERCYPEPERLAAVRYLTTNLSAGETMGDDGNDYDYTLFDAAASTLAQDMPEEIEFASCVLTGQGMSIYYEDKLLSDINYIYADICFFQTFGIPVLKGNPKDMIMPGSAFVSEHSAREMFGDADPIGKILKVDRQNDSIIRGVYRDMPENMVLTHDSVVSIHWGGGYQGRYGWKGNDVFYTFLRPRNVADIDRVNDNIQRVIEKYTPAQYDDRKMNFSVTPLVRYHLIPSDVQKCLIIYSFLGFAIFSVAIVNYMLISIATLSYRAKGVGVHKCSGASSGNIFGMFLVETGILVIFSVLLSLLLIVNAHEITEDLLSVRLSSLFARETLWVPLLTVVILFLLVGDIPGRLFSHIPVMQVFRRYPDGKTGWKRSLLFIQFIGVSFVLGLLLVTLLQYNRLINRDMGMNVPGLARAGTWLPKGTVEHVTDELHRQPMAEGVAVATNGVIGQHWTRGLMSNDGKRTVTLNFNYCSYNYPEVTGIKIIEGSALKKQNDLLVNEELMRLMKRTGGAVGKKLNAIQGTTAGVSWDARNCSFFSTQAFIVLVGSENANHVLDTRLKEPYDENLKCLNELADKTFPNVALHFSSVNGMIKGIYKSIYRFRNPVWVISSFILLIMIMGLVGYVNGETQCRSKEIVIRKANGVEAFHILRLPIREILYVLASSILIGTTVSYFVGKAWLDQLTEQIYTNPLLFVGMATFVLLLIVVYVVLKAWHIASENPVKSTESE